MADVFNIGSSALLALQRAISVTGNNIANVNTDGFSRQRAEFAALPAQRVAAGFIGSGVTVAGITRSFDEFLAGDVRDRSARAGAQRTFADLSARISALFSNAKTGLAPAIDNFFAAVQDVANNPGSAPERRVLLGKGRVLADRFVHLDARLRDVAGETNGRIEAAVRDINSLAHELGRLNDRIVRASAAGSAPNDLLDARDQALNRLSEIVDVGVVRQSNGAVNVFIGNGQSLLTGSAVTELSAFRNPDNPAEMNVGISGLAESDSVERFLRGGELGGALSFRREVLDKARGQLGLIAAGLSRRVNDRHRLGLDLDGNPGQDFFTAAAPAIGANRNNTGAAVVSGRIDDLAALTADRYTLAFDGANYTLTNKTSGVSQTGRGPNFRVDGVAISVSGAPAAGDSFVIAPTENAARSIRVAIDDPREIAAASPLRSSPSADNTGTAKLSELTVNGRSGLPLPAVLTLSFDPDALGAGRPGFRVAGLPGDPIAYNPATDARGITATRGDFSFRLSGKPAAGDRFTIQNNVDGRGDNRNALALARVQRDAVLAGGKATLKETYASLLADVATRSGQARRAADTEKALLARSQAALNSVQGVNLEEEAANLLRFQQSYQAAAQVIAVADKVFQALLGATAR